MEIQFNPDWEHIVFRAARPELEQLAESTQVHIDAPDGAPVETGRLRDSSYAEVDDEQQSILVGADTPYAQYVIYGTENQHANDYLARAFDAALQELRLRNG